MPLFSPPMSLDCTAEDKAVAVIGFSVNNDFSELILINVHRRIFLLNERTEYAFEITPG